MEEDHPRERDEHGCEEILDAAGEGFGVTVGGKRGPDGSWRSHNSSTAMTLDEIDDEKWVGGEWACESPEKTPRRRQTFTRGLRATAVPEAIGHELG